METFYDRTGTAVAYTKDDIHVYSFLGAPLGYFHGNSLYSFGGSHIGWYFSGWICDHAGFRVLFSDGSSGGPLRPVRKLRPMKSVRRIRPLKKVRDNKPSRPLIRLKWSDLTFNDLLRN